MLSLIPIWQINKSRVVSPVQEGSKLPLQIYSTCLPGQCLCLFLDHQKKCWKIRTERWSGRKASTLHFNPIKWIPAHINCFTPQLVSSHLYKISLRCSIFSTHWWVNVSDFRCCWSSFSSHWSCFILIFANEIRPEWRAVLFLFDTIWHSPSWRHFLSPASQTEAQVMFNGGSERGPSRGWFTI